MPTSRPRRAPAARGGCFAVLDPATGEAFDEAPDQRPDELDAIVGRARAAWRGWCAAPAARTTALLAAADAVEAAGADLAPLLTREQGKPLAESHAEVARTAARLRYFAELAPDTQPIKDDRPIRGEVRCRPCRGRRPPAGPAGLLLRPHHPGRCPARQTRGHAGAVRSGPAGAAVRQPRRSHRSGQRHRLRAGRLGMGHRPGPAEAVAGRLECGTAWINHHAETSLAQPFAGIKDSGVGVAGGPWGLYGNLSPFLVHRPVEVRG